MYRRVAAQWDTLGRQVLAVAMIVVLVAGALRPLQALAQASSIGQPLAVDAETLSPGGPTLSAEEPPTDGSTPGGMEVKIGSNASTYVASGDPGRNFGGAGEIRVGYSVTDKQGAMRTLLRFDLNSIPHGVHIYSAELRLHVHSATPGNDGNMDVKVMAVDARHDWSQGGATWSNANFIGGSPSVHGSLGPGGSEARIDVRELVKYWVNGGPNRGILIEGDETPQRGRVRNLAKSAELKVVYRCDTLPPVTGLHGLQPVSPHSFTVSWHGKDKAPSGCTPSGIDQYHVEFSVNNQPWQHFTDRSSHETSHVFNRDVPNGATVSFRIHADDHAGNVEKTPSGAQATTRVINQAPDVVFTALPEWTHASDFMIHWSAPDAPGGVQSYDVQWQIDGGPWQDMLSHTQQTSANFPSAQNDHVYGFRARARDGLGNEGAYPRQAQVQTTVVLYPIAKAVQPSPNIIHSTSPVTTSFTLHWMGKTTPDTTITQYHIKYVVYNLRGKVVQPWSDWKTFDARVTSAKFEFNHGDAIYEFEATATNNRGETTPFTAKAEAIMILDLKDTIDPLVYLPIVRAAK
jgi:hypothetical protein